MATSRGVLAIALMLCSFAGSASAQDLPPHRPGWPRVYLSVDATLRALYDPYTQVITFEEFAENATVTATHHVKRQPTYGGTIGVRFWGALGGGVSVTRVRSHSDGTIDADIPHPFFFDRMRHISGTIPDTTREELAVHGQVRVYVPVRSKFDLVFFGGPSRWRVQQSVLDRVNYTQAYPYDTADFAGADVSNRNVSAWGYNGGVDVSAYVTHNVGVGALIEIATANLPLQRQDGTTFDANVGGLRAGAGLRLRF